MLLRLCVVAVCVSLAGLSAGQTPWDGTDSSRKDRSLTEGSGGGRLSWDGTSDDEDDQRGRSAGGAPSSSVVEGSGAGPGGAAGGGGGGSVAGRGYDDEDANEGSGNGPPSETYPKPNGNDNSGWQTPWEPAPKSDELPGIGKDSGKKNRSGKKKSKVDSGDDSDFTLPGGTNSKPAPSPGNDVSLGPGGSSSSSSSNGNSVADGSGKKTAAGEDVHIIGHGASSDRPASFFAQPGILAAVIGGVVVGLLCTVLLLMYIVYRMRKMDEGSYPLEEPRKTTSSKQSQEFFA